MSRSFVMRTGDPLAPSFPCREMADGAIEFDYMDGSTYTWPRAEFEREFGPISEGCHHYPPCDGACYPDTTP